MRKVESYDELLLRYLDGNLTPDETAPVIELLRHDPEARAFVRDVAEQAVTAADMARIEESLGRGLRAEHGQSGSQQCPSV